MINKEFPQVIYAYAILLDNEINNWEITARNKTLYEFNSYWKINRVNDYRLEKICYVCNNSDEINKVYYDLAPKWFKT